MRILVAPTAFKGTLSATKAARAMVVGATLAHPEAVVVSMPIADGGDGFLESVMRPLKLRLRTVKVHHALGRLMDAEYGLRSGKAVIEMARASGLAQLQANELDPMRATSIGAGELAADAIAQGAQDIVMGLGGSASNDAGAGLLTALGFRFLDKEGAALPPGGAALIRLHTIEPPPIKPNAAFTIAADVTNPLCGPEGASAVYGPQKGASPLQVTQLDDALAKFADVAERTFGRRVRDVPGAGAAGGAAAGMLVCLDGKLVSGIEFVFDVIGFRDALQRADVLLTGEGKFDAQSLQGKAVGKAIDAARATKTPIMIFCGVSELTASQVGAEVVVVINSLTSSAERLAEAVTEGLSIGKNPI